MHSYLRTIGFSKLKDRIMLEQLLCVVKDQPTQKKVHLTEDGKTIVELSKNLTKTMGITLRGEYDSEGEIHMEHYFPHFISQNISTREELTIMKRVDTDAYTGMCDDIRLGVSLIFYIQNTIDFMNDKGKRAGQGIALPIHLSALSLSGKILLPLEHDEKLEKSNNMDLQYRRNLIIEAKKGNQDAIDSLTIDDIDMYALISRRSKSEDIYTIVETSFTPFGSESDNYLILGNIIELEKEINMITEEEIYNLTISCNDLFFQVAINKEDLVGEPMIGRRFKGTVWLQGYVNFEELNFD